MQKTLTILRHAKAAAAGAGMEDKDRPLAERGLEEAVKMGQYLAAQKIFPQLVLCSTSKRTRQTWELAQASLPMKLPVEYSDGLYHAAANDMIKLLSQLPDDLESVMLVGHNPGLHDLAIKLARRGDSHLLNLMTANFPPCTLAEIGFDSGWKDIKKAGGTLTRFVVPAMFKE